MASAVLVASAVLALAVLALVARATLRDAAVFKASVTVEIAKVVSEVESKVRVRLGGLPKEIVPEVPRPVRLLKQASIQ